LGNYFCYGFNACNNKNISLLNLLSIGDYGCSNGGCPNSPYINITGNPADSMTIGSYYCSVSSSCSNINTIRIGESHTTIGSYFCSNGGCDGTKYINLTHVEVIKDHFCFNSCGLIK